MLAIACFAFLFKALWKYRQTLLEIEDPPAAAAYAAIAAVAFAAIVFISAYAWKLTLQFLYGKPIGYREVRGVYAKANIAKYLPGNVMHFAGRNALGGKLGFSQFDMALSTLIEVLVLLFTAVAWSLVLAHREFADVMIDTVGRVRSMTGAWFPAAVAGIALFLAAAACAGLLVAYRKGLFKQFRKLFTFGFLGVFLRLLGIYSLTMLLPGACLVLIFTKVVGASLTLHGVVIVMVGYVLSWAIGYIIPIPGGLGVRETAEYFIIGTVCPLGITIVAVILHRVASIAGDALAFACEIGIERLHREDGKTA